MITITEDYFNLRQIADSGQCFRMTALGAGEYELISGDRYIRLKQEGNRISFACSQEEYETVWRPFFDLDTDYGEFISRINPRDTFLVKAAEYGSGMRILRQDLWETMVTFLISQQNNLPRIRRCISLLCEKYGNLCRTDEGISYYGFPAPEKLAGLPEDGLLSCNLGYRSKYVVRTAADIVSGKTDLEKIRSASPSEAKEELMKCFGVGEKVAECICLFSLHHLDAFPVDTHIRKVLDEHYKRGFPNRRYKGFRGVIQQYLFYYDLKQGMKEGE